MTLGTQNPIIGGDVVNYSLLPWLLLCNILEMADVETPNNRATSANDIPNSFTRNDVRG